MLNNHQAKGEEKMSTSTKVPEKHRFINAVLQQNGLSYCPEIAKHFEGKKQIADDEIWSVIYKMIEKLAKEGKPTN